ncbi:DUF2267 domain-containing protein [Haloplanus sp. GCM10025708]|uniref:DUF2267 domain-containing protein n=1 Tax=Haloferacaceae TaxID=1644056 RepID=UPI003621101D
MKTANVIERVRQRREFASTEEAEEVTAATLEALGRVVPADDARNVAVELPPELAQRLRAPEDRDSTDSVDEFLAYVHDNASVREAGVEWKVNGVFDVLEETVGDEFADVQAQLPDEYDRLR